MSTRIKAILWDNDGVLVDTEDIYFRATQSVLRDVGVRLDVDDYRKHFLTSSAGAWHLAAELGYSKAAIEGFRQKRNDLYAQELHRNALEIDGAREVLEMLHGEVRMAVVTSSRRRHFEIIHERTGFMKYFEFALVREDYVNSKPDPEPYLAAVARIGLSPDECIVIEDSERGLRAAVAAGIRCWVIPHALSGRGDFSTANRVMSSIDEVPAAIARLPVC